MGGLLSAIKGMQILGWFDDLGNWIMDHVVGHVLWLFSDIFFLILELFEKIFKAFAGIGTGVKDSAGEAIEGDLVLYFISSDLIQDIFISILILSVILLIIFTIFAIIKNQYAEKQEPVKGIIAKSFKGLWLYMLIPVVTVVCLVVGNIVLQAIDGATKLTDSGSAADMLFSCATYNANRLRGDDPNSALLEIKDRLPDNVKLQMENACGGLDVDNPSTYSAADWELLADIIDTSYVNGSLGGEWSNFSIINKYYSASQISYITIWIGGAFLIWAIGKMAWGMVARLFKMVLYFAISPAVVATYPIKGDGPLKSWSGEMVKNGTSAYCAVGVINVLYSVLPFVTNINFGLLGDLGTSIARLFIYIIAFSSAQNLVSTVSGWFGTGDAIKEGKDAKGQVKSGFETAKKSLAKPGQFIGKTVGVLGAYQGGVKAADDDGKKKFWQKVGGGLQGVYSQTEIGKGLNKMRGDYGTALKGGGDQYKQFATSGLGGFGLEDKDKAEKFAGREILNKEKTKLRELQEKLSKATSEAERKRIRAEMGNFSLAQERKKDAEAEIEIRESANKEVSEVSSSFVQLKELADDIESLAKRILGEANVNEATIDALRKGDIKAATSGMSAQEKQLAGRQWKMLGGDFATKDIEFSNTKDTIKALIKNDSRVKNLSEEAGFKEYSSIKLGGNWDAFKKAVVDKVGEIQEESGKIAEARRDVGNIIEKAAKDTLNDAATEKEIQKIGKNAGK